MATRLPQVQGGRAQVQGVPNVVLPEVRFGQRDVSAAYREQAQYQSAVSQTISRMSQAVFGLAEGMSERAGLQFSAENPLTAEQLEAMSRGDMSQVQLGSPLNVFNAAVRKARALEVSGHAEAEARQQMIDLVQRANMGELDADQVYGQITAITNGYAESLAGIDPDASYKFRATAGAIGNRVLEKVGELDSQKRMIANTVKVQRMYSNLQQEISLAATTKMPIDPSTGQELPATAYVDALKQNFLINAQALVGVTGASQYVNSIDNDINESVVNSIAQYLNTDPGFSYSANGIERLLRGDAGSASNAFQQLLPEDRDKVIAEYRNMRAMRKADAEAGAARSQKAEKDEIDNLISMFYDPLTPQEERVRIGRELGYSSGLSSSQKDTFLNPSQPSGDPVKFAEVQGAIQRGVYSDTDQIKEDANLLGFNGNQLAKLIEEFNKGPQLTASERSARSFLKQSAGVPDVTSSFVATADEKDKIDKNIALQNILSDLVTDFRTTNPSGLVPFQQLAQQATQIYENTTSSDKKQKAALENIQIFLDAAASRVERSDARKAERIRNVKVDTAMNPVDMYNAGLIDIVTQQAIERELDAIRGRQ
jgi:hypothetical protein